MVFCFESRLTCTDGEKFMATWNVKLYPPVQEEEHASDQQEDV
jgi:hypothetical protein